MPGGLAERAISTFLQRVGRSNHSRHGVPEGILFPTTRDELVECAALLAAVRKGRLDAVLPPVAPLDILAQQVIAEVAAAGEWKEDGLSSWCAGPLPTATCPGPTSTPSSNWRRRVSPQAGGRAWPTSTATGSTGRPAARRGARLAALTSGGAIPEVGDYRVVAEPEEMFVGTLNEDFAIESMAGDVFLLGTHSWRIRRVTPGEVRVIDAQGAAPHDPVLGGRGAQPYGRALGGGFRPPAPASNRGSSRRAPRPPSATSGSHAGCRTGRAERPSR